MSYCSLFCLVTLFFLFLMFTRTSCNRYESPNHPKRMFSHLKWVNLIPIDSDGDQLFSSVQGSAVVFNVSFGSEVWKRPQWSQTEEDQEPEILEQSAWEDPPPRWSCSVWTSQQWLMYHPVKAAASPSNRQNKCWHSTFLKLFFLQFWNFLVLHFMLWHCCA